MALTQLQLLNIILNQTKLISAVIDQNNALTLAFVTNEPVGQSVTENLTEPPYDRPIMGLVQGIIGLRPSLGDVLAGAASQNASLPTDAQLTRQISAIQRTDTTLVITVRTWLAAQALPVTLGAVTTWLLATRYLDTTDPYNVSY